MAQTLKCGCGAGFTSSANLKRHLKLCKKTNESDDSDAQSVHSDTSTSLHNKSQLNRMEAKIDLLLNNNKIDITSITTQTPKQNNKIDITSITTQTPKQPAKLKVKSSKPTISFEELCLKDFDTAKDAVKHQKYSYLGCNGIVALFRDVLQKYKIPPFKYINTPTKKNQKDAECVIHKFEDNICIFKDNSWKPMTRDDTDELFYNLFIVLENNYPTSVLDDEEINEEHTEELDTELY